MKKLRRFLVLSSVFATGLVARSAAADNVLVWTGGQGHGGISNAVSVLTSLGHNVTQSATVPADLSPYDNLWALDFSNGPDAPDEKAMVAAFLNSDRGVYAQFEWDCCTNSQIQWTATLTPLLKDPFLIQGSQGVSQNSVAEPTEVFGLTTTPYMLPFLQINATANIVTIPDANVVYRLNGIPVVGAYVDPQFVSGDGCIVLAGDIEELVAAPQAAQWIANVQYFLQNCIPNPQEICGDGFLAVAETCDDGNATSGDGCSATCDVEVGYECSNDTSQTPVSKCTPTCATGQPCTVGVGACEAAGTIFCVGGGPEQCNAKPGLPGDESCDGKDNDCDGTADEGFGLGVACSSGIGPCAASGTIVCDGGGGTKCDAVPLCGDADGDGLSDDDEIAIGTDPLDGDSDDDGVLDGDEVQPGLDSDGDGLINALDPDSDNDGLFDGTELGFGCDHPDTDASAGHCVPDGDGGATTTNPINADSDGGGASDASEDPNGNGVLDPGEGDPGGAGDDGNIVDTDGDGLSDALELVLGTSPTDGDSDDDGVTDGIELNPTLDDDGDGLVNLLDCDSDNDGLFDGTELGKGCQGPDTDAGAQHCIADADGGATKTSPIDPDSDDGGAKDGNEDFNHNGKLDAGEQNPTAGNGADDVNVVDSDGDGLSDGEEVVFGSDVNDGDSDDDGVLDGNEPNATADDDGDGLINALDADSDDDGIFDGTELGLDCSNEATDLGTMHCIADADGGATTTSSVDADSDGDGVKDGVEDGNHNGVVDGGETNPNNPTDGVCVQSSDCALDSQVCDPATSQCVDAKCDQATVCPAPDACHVGGLCNPASGLCEYGNKPNGTACADDNVCTFDTCQSGTCSSVSLLDGTPCTEDGESGACLAGNCFADSGGNGAGSTTGNGGSVNAGGSGGEGGNGNGNGGADGGSSNAGGSGNGNGNGGGGANGDATPAYSLLGSGCTAGGSSTGSTGGIAGLALALGLALARRRSRS